MNDHSRLAAPNRRVALLVDGENLAANFADEILLKAREFGEPNIRRVYGKIDDLKNKNWAASQGFRLIAASNSKNSADLLLSVEAMELALDRQVDAIVIAASDHDYTHVALKLRERGFPVFGLIEQDRACDGLRAAYADVRNLNGNAGAEKSPVLPITKAIPLLRRVIAKSQLADGWATLVWLDHYLPLADPSFHPAQYGASDLGDLVRRCNYFEVDEGTAAPFRFRKKVPVMATA